MQELSKRDLEELRHQETLARIRFCHGLVQYAIALASLVIAGLGGIFAGKEALKNVNFELLIALFSLGSGLIFQILNLMLTQEEWLMRQANKGLITPVKIPSALLDTKFIFITVLALVFPLFGWWYLADVRVADWFLKKSPLLVLWVLNLVILSIVLIIRLKCSSPSRFLQSPIRLLRRLQEKLSAFQEARKEVQDEKEP